MRAGMRAGMTAGQTRQSPAGLVRRALSVPVTVTGEVSQLPPWTCSVQVVPSQ